MKIAVGVLFLLLIAIFLVWFFTPRIDHENKAAVVLATKNGPPSAVAKPVNSAPAVTYGPLTLNDWEELSTVRETTIRHHPELTAEREELAAEMDEQMKELYAAMIKADPKVTPILAKLESLSKAHAVPANPTLGK